MFNPNEQKEKEQMVTHVTMIKVIEDGDHEPKKITKFRVAYTAALQRAGRRIETDGQKAEAVDKRQR